MRKALEDILAPIYYDNCGPTIDHPKMKASMKETVDKIIRLFNSKKCTKKK